MRHPRMDDFFARFLVAETGIAVLAVDYDTAPQVRYPVAQEEAHDVAAYVAEPRCRAGPRRRSARDRRLQRRRQPGRLRVPRRPVTSDTFAARFQLLGVPSLDLAESYADKQPVGSPMLAEGIHHLVRATYFNDASRRTEPYASPLRAESLAGLPPTLIVTGGMDLLSREGHAYARRLAEAGVTVQHRTLPRADHYFLSRENVRVELGLMARALAAHLE